MGLEVTPDKTGRCAKPERLVEAAKSFGLDLATTEEILQLRDVAAALFDAPIAAASTFDAVNRKTGASVFGFRPKGYLEGYLALITLTPLGLERLNAGVFDGVDVDLKTVCAPGEIPAALYVWGAATLNVRAAYRMVTAFRAMRAALYWALPLYTRMSSEKGARLAIERMALTPLSSDPSLACAPPYSSYEATRA